jgi:hypothetical protein
MVLSMGIYELRLLRCSGYCWFVSEPCFFSPLFVVVIIQELFQLLLHIILFF